MLAVGCCFPLLLYLAMNPVPVQSAFPLVATRLSLLVANETNRRGQPLKLDQEGAVSPGCLSLS